MAGCAGLLALLALLRWRSLPARAGTAIVAGLLIALPIVSAAVAPAAAVEPLAIALLAASAGLAAATMAGESVPSLAVLRAVAAAGGFVAAHGLYQKLWGLQRLARLVAADPGLPDREAVMRKLEAGRAFAGFSTPAAMGGFLALTLPVTAALAIASSGRRRAGWAALFVLQTAGLLATASVTAAAALVGATLLAALLWTRSRRGLVVAVAVMGLLLAAVVVQRGNLLDPSDPSSPLRLRAGNWRSAMEMAGDHPWLGVGPGGFPEAYLEYRRPGDNEARHAHNLPLEVASEVGWPAGMLIAATFFVLFLGPLRRLRAGAIPLWQRGVAVSLAAFAIHNLADFTAFMPSVLWSAALLRGLLARPRDPSAVATPPALAGRAVALAAVLVAGLVAGASGISHDWQFSAREAAHAGDNRRSRLLAERAALLAPWDIDAGMAAARATLGPGPAATLSPAERQLAFERVERVVRMSPRRPSARELRARIRLGQGDLLGALADIEQAVRLDPSRKEYARTREDLGKRLHPAPAKERG